MRTNGEPEQAQCPRCGTSYPTTGIGTAICRPCDGLRLNLYVRRAQGITEPEYWVFRTPQEEQA